MTTSGTAVRAGDLFSQLASDTCWILGAGASYDCIGPGRSCTPLTNQLLSWDDFDESFRRDLGKVLTQRGSTIYLENSITSRLEQTIDSCRASKTDRGAHCLEVLTRKIGENLRDEQVVATLARGESIGYRYCAENYLWLASETSHNPRQSVLTLNYDTVLDHGYDQLRNATPGPKLYFAWQELLKSHQEGLRSPARSNGIYLKLHGSLDLISCHNLSCRLYRTPRFQVFRAGEFIFEKLRRRDDICEECGKPVADLILPPGKNKTLEEDAFHRRVYAEARKALQARTWVVIGYSFPEYDQDLRALMQEAIRSSKDPKLMIVVSPDANVIAPRIGQALSLAVGAAEWTFSGLIDWIFEREGRERPGLA